MNNNYKNSTELMNLHGVPIYMNDMVDACLFGRLNLFLQGDTGSGKTQLAKDTMSYFPEKSLFILGRNDMDTRELMSRINLGKLFQKPKYNLEPLANIETEEIDYYYPVFKNGVFTQIKLSHEQTERVRKSLEKLAGTTENLKELTSKIKTQLFITDELPNCVPAVRAQLFNLYDGFIELDGKAYPLGNYFVVEKQNSSLDFLEAGVPIETIEALRKSGAKITSDNYSVGIATGNVGQKFTESTNEIGRALKDRMHVIIDTDYFHPNSSDTLEILAGNTNPRVEFSQESEDKSGDIIAKHNSLVSAEIPFEKLLIANYLIHGLDYCSKGSKRKMKDRWPNDIENNPQGSDEALVLPVSVRASKSIVRLSQALDKIAEEKGIAREAIEKGYFDSMMQAYKFVSAYSGVLNEAAVNDTYSGDKYSALDAVIATTKTQFEEQGRNIAEGLKMIKSGKSSKKVLNSFTNRWAFMQDTLEGIANSNKS